MVCYFVAFPNVVSMSEISLITAKFSNVAVKGLAEMLDAERPTLTLPGKSGSNSCKEIMCVRRHLG